MALSIFQQRYHSDQGWIVVSQEGLDPAAGETVFLENGEPAPDGVYRFGTAEQDRYIEVREGLVHFYYHRKRETDIGTGNTVLIIVLFLLLLFILFRVIGRQP
jgi:hypothetical protein